METAKKYTRENSELVLEAKGLIEITTSSIPLKITSSNDDNVHVFLTGESTLSEWNFINTNSTKGCLVIYDYSYILDKEEKGSLVLNIEIPKKEVVGDLTLHIRDKEPFIQAQSCNIHLIYPLDALIVNADITTTIAGLIPRVVKIDSGLSNTTIFGNLYSYNTFLDITTHTGDITIKINGSKQYECITKSVYRNDKSKKENTLNEDGLYDMSVYGMISTNSGAIILI